MTKPKRKFYYKKQTPDKFCDCYKSLLIETIYSNPNNRSFAEVLWLRKEDSNFSFLRRLGDWNNYDIKKVQEMNEVEAITLRVAHKWMEEYEKTKLI